MRFFDSIISEVNDILAPHDRLSYTLDSSWTDSGRNELVLRRDSAFELDGIGFNLVTSQDIGDDGVDVIGDDLPSISSDRSFARISYIRLEDIDDEQKAYDLIRKIEYSKYHFFPRGYMSRAVSDTHKEVARLSKSAIADGLDFRKVGSLLIDKYKQNSAVKAARVVFVTDASVNYKALDALARRNYEITEALNHIMSNISFDCDACNLKKICDEVEGMRELHFKNAGM